MLNRTKIRSLTHASFYSRGLDLYLCNKVKDLKVEEGSFLETVTAHVEGSGTKEYTVRFRYDDVRDEVVLSECDCPAYYSYEGLCKHIVASMLKYVDARNLDRKLKEGEDGEARGWQRDTAFSGQKALRANTTESMRRMLNRQLVQKTAPLVQGGVFGKVRLEPALTVEGDKATVEFRIGVGSTYILKDVLQFAERMKQGEEFEYGKKLKFTHLMEAFEPESRALAAFICGWAKENGDRYSQMAYFGFPYAASRASVRRMTLSGGGLEDFIEAMGERSFSAMVQRFPAAAGKEDDGEESREEDGWQESDGQGADGRREAFPTYHEIAYYKEIFWRRVEGFPRRKLRIVDEEDGVRLYVVQPTLVEGERYDVSFDAGNVYLEPRQGADTLREFHACAREAGEKGIYLQKEDVPAFCRDLLPILERHYSCDKEGFHQEKYDFVPVSFEIYLDAPAHDIVTCRVMAVYDGRKYNVYGEKTDSGLRDLVQEIAVGQAVLAACGVPGLGTSSMVVANTEDQIYEILREGIPRMQELGEVFVSDALKRIKVTQPPHVTVGVSLSGDLLELSMTTEDMSEEELLEILNRYDRKKKYYRLRNGNFVNVRGEGLEVLAQLKHDLGLNEKQLSRGTVTLPKYRALFLDGELKGSRTLSAVKNKAFRALIRDMRTVDDNDFEVPAPLDGVLREYQKRGFLWLKTLKHNGLGGILADDMGLGKTIQVLAFLYSEFREAGEGENRRCLIVTPASLVYNWYSEIMRFVPKLPAAMVVGDSQRRRDLIEEAGPRQVLITSYDLLKRDLEHYEGQEFFCQVIDEAQFIKNHNTQAAKAVKEIQAGCKLALTGTPMENRLSELWSIFDYLMPGFFYSYQRFREELEVPIVQQQDQAAMERLQKMIRPFVLRRLKRDVLKELPEKLEEEVYAVLEGEQQKLYDAHVKRLALMLEEQSDEEFRSSKIQVLAELTKLRQLCCDPSLLYEGVGGESAKKQMCMDLIRNAVAGGHKVLLFSQFTSMLDILCRQLEQEQITFYTLTGSTSKERRKELVERFQRPDGADVFCISLKAGGTGLNLTAADIVIHYDPWWNLAAQNQATDRAHRIGQRNVVTVYRLITKGTIEENILRLQERKRDLAERVLDGGQVGTGSFTRQELMEIIGISGVE